MSTKKRFGVSVPVEIAVQLDKVAGFTGKDRSSIVTSALQEYIHEDLHEGAEHACSGVIVYSGNLPPSSVGDTDFKAVVRSLCTVKLRGEYVTVLFVEGSSRDILLLRRSLSKIVGKAGFMRYIPLYCSYTR